MKVQLDPAFARVALDPLKGVVRIHDSRDELPVCAILIFYTSSDHVHDTDRQVTPLE